MATDAQLTVALSANITNLTKALKRAGVELDGFEKDADRKTKAASRKIQDNLGKAANDNGALRLDQWQNLSFQMNDVISGLAMGQRPLQVMTQQSGQIYQILSSANGGVSGALKEIATRAIGLATPFNLMAGAVLGVGTAAYLLGTRWSDAQSKIEQGLTGIGRISGATVRDINDIAEAAASAGKMTLGTARDIATALAATGKIGKGQIGAVTGLAPGYAKLLGVDVAKAGEELAKIFSDPSKGADEMNARLGSLDSRTREYIRTLQAQGDSQGAILALVRNVQPELDAATKKTGLWADAWNAVANAADRMGAAVGKAISPSDLQRMSQLIKDRRAAEEGTEPGVLDAYRSQGLSDDEISSRGLVPSFDLKRVQQLTREIDAYQKKIDAVNKANETTAADKAANALSQRADAIVKQYDAAGEAIKAVENQIVDLERALKDSAATGKMDSGTAQAQKTLGAMRDQVAQLKKDYAEGGAAAAAALRSAKFQQEVAGLNSYQRGLREITERFKEMREAAVKAANVDALPNIRDAERAAIAAHSIQSSERAKAQVAIPQGYAAKVMWVESSGDDNAKNKMPGQTATGAGQFTNGTWLGLFKKEFAELAGTMSDAAILGLRTNRDYTVKMIDAYARENGAALNRAGYDSSDRNLYLAHHLGPGGAIKALGADRSASAASVLGQREATLNPGTIGGGRNIGQMLDVIDRRLTGNSAMARSIKDATLAEQQNAEAMGKSTAETERLSAVSKLLNEDREKGGELGQKYATAEALIKASSDQLTPALAAQRDEWLKIADARAKASATDVSARLKRDLDDQYAALGRTPDEQRVYQQARQYSAPGSDNWDRTISGLTRLQEITSVKDSTGSFLKGMTSDLLNGAKASEALTSQLKKLAASLADNAIDSLLSGLFPSGGGGLLGKLLGGGGGAGGSSATAIPGFLNNYADGGFTGQIHTTHMEVLR